jgi:hypothetical protein
MLHHPFVDWTDLLSVDGQVYGSYIEAFRACTQLQRTLQLHSAVGEVFCKLCMAARIW